MLALISPAKQLDLDSPLPPADVQMTQPALLTQVAPLAALLKQQSAADLARLMKLSPALAALNHERYAALNIEAECAAATTLAGRPAAYCYAGDVYRGLNARAWTSVERQRAQSQLRILSGLYGILRPMDSIAAHRLEMGTRLPNPRGASLYAYWSEAVTSTIIKILNDVGGPLVNLASAEYFKVVDTAALKRAGIEVITPVFKDGEPGAYRVISFHAKRARGLMASYILRERLEASMDLQGFDDAGYEFDAALSITAQPVFVRAPISR